MLARKIKKLTNFKWLNLFKINYKNKLGKDTDWMMASRKEDPSVKSTQSDAVVIIPFLNNKMVVIKQYRPPIGDYVIEHPAGLIDDGESPLEAAERELKEEVGLETKDSFLFSKMLYNSPGITDESVSYVISQAFGVPHTQGNESSEDIEIIIVDKLEAKKLLESNEKFSAKCWLILTTYANGELN